MAWISRGWKEYEVLDATQGLRLESWAGKLLVRPDPQVIWATERKDPRWNRFDAKYHRSSTGGGRWEIRSLPESWLLHYKDDLTFHVKPMNFKHTGVFPEQAANWDYIREKVEGAGRPVRVLNLFAYSGGATLAAAAGGAEVWHVDAAKGMVAMAKENAAASGLADRPIHWIVDDCGKFIQREIRRGRKYDGVIMDPPSYGRGPSQEIRRRVDEALRQVGLYEYREHAPHLLSGGQKQRVAIAGVIAMRPKCIVLDEPTAMLDPRGREEVMEIVSDLNRRLGITVVLITHHMDEAARAQRVVVLDRGEIAADGPPKKVFSQVELLHRLGLSAPETVELCWQLRKAGQELPLDTLTIEECAQALRRWASA